MKVYFDEQIAFYAFRYTLGRKTYAVQNVVEYLQQHWQLLSQEGKDHIQQEIREAIEQDRIGMDMDRESWKKLLEL